MALFEVFGRRRPDDPLVHVGSVHAPDVEAALHLVRETHFRHEEGTSYAVVPSDHVHELDDPELLDRQIETDYRQQRGYSGFRDKRAAAHAAAVRRGRGDLTGRAIPGRAAAPDGDDA